MLEDRTTLNPSTIDVMVDSPSKQKPARYKLPSYDNKRSFEFESV